MFISEKVSEILEGEHGQSNEVICWYSALIFNRVLKEERLVSLIIIDNCLTRILKTKFYLIDIK